jgi:hypothetical protein
MIATLSLIGFMAWLDNVHINTANGLWKSLVVGQWKADFATAPLDPSNYLYYPLVSTLCRLLDLLRIQVGEAWRQLASINTIFAGIAVAIVYWMVRRLTGRRDIAAIAALFHLGSAFFLSLAIMDEDIMPSYTFVLAAMAMAAVWFSSPTAAQVACVAMAFTLGWLIEWRLMFPTLPPLLLALALSRGQLLRRAGLILLFLATMLGVTLLVVLLWDGHNGAAGLQGILWTGKGINTAWGGFSWHKLDLVVSGMGEYWLGGRFITGQYLTFFRDEWGLAFTFQALLLAAFALLLWRNRHDPKLRNVATVFLGTLAAGQAMNAYSQPEDPQMQINVMPWLTVVVALILAWLAGSTASRRATAVAAILVLLPLAYNVKVFSASRGLDGQMQAALRELEGLSDPAQTVYVYSSYEYILAWHYARWTPRGPGVCDLGPSPQAVPKFKWIGLTYEIANNPSWTKEQYVAHIKAQLDCAFDKGYRVIAGAAWIHFESEIDGWMALLHARDHGLALVPLLQTYRIRSIGGPLADYPEGYFEITRL